MSPVYYRHDSIISCSDSDLSTIEFCERNNYEQHKMNNMMRLLKALGNIARYTCLSWYNTYNHVIDSLERYENTCKKRVNSDKNPEKYSKSVLDEAPKL